MASYRCGVRAVAALDFIICVIELVCYWWNRYLVFLQESYLVLELILTGVLFLRTLAAINLFVATLHGNLKIGSVPLCKFWLIINVIWIGLEVLVVLVIMVIFLTLGRAFGVSLDRWTSTYIMIFQIETCFRLIGMYIVDKFIEKLKLGTTIPS